jgi:uncharacterized protein YegP (UPF0339 family)
LDICTVKYLKFNQNRIIMLNDDYLPCGQYENQPKHASAKDFSSFVNVKTGKHFFALIDHAGSVMLRSEAYETQNALETGIKSVQTNMTDAKRFGVVADGKQFVVCLKAANHREIARSCPFDAEKDAKALLVRLTSKTPLVVVKPTVKKAPAKPAVAKVAAKPAAKPAVAKAVAKPAVAKAVAKPVVAKVAAKPVAKPVVAKVVAKPVAKPVVAKVVAKPVAKPVVAKAVAKPVAKPVVAKADAKPVVTKAVAKPVAKAVVAKPAAKPAAVKASSVVYQQCDFYAGHETLQFGDIKTGYAKFTGKDGSFYFTVYNPNGSSYLNSCAYKTEALRDKAFVTVVQSIENPAYYNVVESGNAFFMVLSDSSNQEIARSCGFASFTEAFKCTPNGRERSDVTLY